MKKFFKLLCYSLIAVFLLGLGGEKVVAAPQSFRATEGDAWIKFKKDNGRDWWSSVKYISGGNEYVFCLDSNKYIFKDGNMILLVPPERFARSYNSNNFEEYIGKIMTRAYLLGLDSNKTSYSFKIGNESYNNISSKDFYGIIQSAVWYAAHGNSYDGGYYGPYQKWIKDNEYSDIFNYLISSEDIAYSINFSYNAENNIPNGVLKQESEQSPYLVSGAYKIKSDLPDGVRFNAKISTSAQGFVIQMKVNDGEWTTVGENGVDVSRNDVLRFRAKKPEGNNGNSQVDITLNLTSGNYVTGADVFMYYAEGNNTANSDKQNLVYPQKKLGSMSTSLVLRGNYTSTGTIRMAKVTPDPRANHQEQNIFVAGATLELYKNSNPGVVISSFISEADYVTVNVPLEAGVEYCIRETKAPTGFVLDKTKTACDTFTNAKTTLELKLENKEQRIKYKKVDQEGNPIAGIRIEFHEYLKENVSGRDYPYMCGITDSNGFLTRPCPEANPSNENYDPRIISPASDGTFGISLNDERGTNNDSGTGDGLFFPIDGREDEKILYAVKEYFEDGINSKYYNDMLDGTKPVFGLNYEDDAQVKGLVASEGTLKFLRVLNEAGEEGTFGVDPVVVLEFKNYRFAKFTKTDTGTGEEIDGAQMLLFDLTAEEWSTGVKETTLLDEWVSEKDKPHYYQGLEVGHTYILKEVTPPKDYVKLETDIQFTVDEDGKIILADGAPSQVLLASNDSELSKLGGDILDRWIIVGNDMYPPVPNTGISLLNKIAVGCLLVFVGYEVIKIYRKKANS